MLEAHHELEEQRLEEVKIDANALFLGILKLFTEKRYECNIHVKSFYLRSCLITKLIYLCSREELSEDVTDYLI